MMAHLKHDLEEGILMPPVEFYSDSPNRLETDLICEMDPGTNLIFEENEKTNQPWNQNQGNRGIVYKNRLHWDAIKPIENFSNSMTG